jgi:hypothetical protein
MAQQGKQMRVGAREGFAYHSLELVLLANVNEYEVDSNAFFLGGKALYPFTVLPCHNIDLFFTRLYLLSVVIPRQAITSFNNLSRKKFRNDTTTQATQVVDDGRSSFSTHFVTVFNPISLLACAARFCMKLKTCT